MFTKLTGNPSNRINMICFIDIDQDVIQVDNHKNV